MNHSKDWDTEPGQDFYAQTFCSAFFLKNEVSVTFQQAFLWFNPCSFVLVSKRVIYLNRDALPKCFALMQMIGKPTPQNDRQRTSVEGSFIFETGWKKLTLIECLNPWCENYAETLNVPTKKIKRTPVRIAAHWQIVVHVMWRRHKSRQHGRSVMEIFFCESDVLQPLIFMFIWLFILRLLVNFRWSLIFHLQNCSSSQI